jgi:hypothetical protein
MLACKAATEDPEGAFTSAASEASLAGVEEEERLAAAATQPASSLFHPPHC